MLFIFNELNLRLMITHLNFGLFPIPSATSELPVTYSILSPSDGGRNQNPNGRFRRDPPTKNATRELMVPDQMLPDLP